MAGLVYKAGQVTGGDADRTVSMLLNQLTEWSSVTGSTLSDPNYRVGVGRPGTDLGWGQNGFQSEYQDRDPNSMNQVRHFAFYLSAGHQLGIGAVSGLYLHEGSISSSNGDVRLGEVAIQWGADFDGNYRKLAQDIWHDLCGQQSSMNLP